MRPRRIGEGGAAQVDIEAAEENAAPATTRQADETASADANAQPPATQAGDNAPPRPTGTANLPAPPSDHGASAVALQARLSQANPVFEDVRTGSGPMLRRGSGGDQVRELQKTLNRLGLADPPLPEDGSFDARTEAAIRRFQEQNGCKVDGIVGPQTMGALDRAQGFEPHQAYYDANRRLGGGPTEAPAGPPAPGTDPNAPPTAPASGGPPGPNAPPTRPPTRPPATPTTPPTTPPTAPPTTPTGPSGPTGPTTPVSAGTSAFPQSAEAVRQQGAWTRAGMPGRISVSNMPSNGNRPVAVYVPRNLDPSQPVKVMTYFHGHGGNAGENLSRGQVLERIQKLEAEHPNTVFVIPQAGRQPFSYWMKPPGESYAQLEQQALGEAARLAGAPSLEVGERIAAAHSGGGLALSNAVTSGQLRANRIELLDSSYGGWSQNIARWAMRQPEGRQPTIEAWSTAGATRDNDAEIRRMAPRLVRVHNSPVGHGAIPGRFLGSTLGG